MYTNNDVNIKEGQVSFRKNIKNISIFINKNIRKTIKTNYTWFSRV